MIYIALGLIFIIAVCAAYSITVKLRKPSSQSYRVTKDTMMGEFLSKSPESAKVLSGMGMHCIGCPSHNNETLEDTWL
ncbi:MAG: DUF1858 domain-containing protein [Eubacteriales bacterium]|nr:DUF1858 domain-containing protein [Eubacteriales bacterium]